jgi:ParB family chromosome partitioning protein
MNPTPRRTGLGRGLASLIPDSALDVGASEGGSARFRSVPLDEIDANPEQPRLVFDPKLLASLAASIKTHGIMSPLIVRREEGRYLLIAGERRLRAAALAGLTEVPVVVRDLEGEAEALELALVENLQRADLDPIEAAKGYQRLKSTYGYTQEQVSVAVGLQRSTVANALRLLKLPVRVLTALREGQITAGHARALLPLSHDEAELARVLTTVVVREWSVRRLEQVVSEMTRLEPAKTRSLSPGTGALKYATRLLTKSLKTAVQISPRKRGGGKIVIQYANAEELERLITELRNDG